MTRTGLLTGIQKLSAGVTDSEDRSRRALIPSHADYTAAEDVVNVHKSHVTQWPGRRDAATAPAHPGPAGPPGPGGSDVPPGPGSDTETVRLTEPGTIP